MAKNTGKSGGTARVRFIMLDAEVPDGDLSQITTAIQNAFKPTTIIQRAPNGNAAPKALEHDATEHPLEEEVDEESIDETPSAPRQRVPRKPAAKPSVIQFDITSEPALSTLTDPGSNHKRYLKIAAWLHDHRSIEAVSADHIYTAYRHLGWPTDILDFAQPLRELKHKQYFTTPERGKYAINQLGLAKAAETD